MIVPPAACRLPSAVCFGSCATRHVPLMDHIPLARMAMSPLSLTRARLLAPLAADYA